MFNGTRRVDKPLFTFIKSTIYRSGLLSLNVLKSLITPSRARIIVLLLTDMAVRFLAEAALTSAAAGESAAVGVSATTGGTSAISFFTIGTADSEKAGKDIFNSPVLADEGEISTSLSRTSSISNRVKTPASESNRLAVTVLKLPLSTTTGADIFPGVTWEKSMTSRSGDVV